MIWWDVLAMLVAFLSIATLIVGGFLLVGWMVEHRRSRPVLPPPTLAEIMSQRSIRRELELADWDAEFSVAIHEAKHGVTLRSE